MEVILVKNDLFNKRISRFSIRKLNVGVCSVLLGTLVMLGTNTGVAAEEFSGNKKTEEVAVKEKKEQSLSLSKNQTETKSELNQTRLQAYIAEIEARLANGKYSNKTDESVELLKASLVNAQNTLSSARSQAELDAAYQSLFTTVNAKLKSKKAVKVEKPLAETPSTTESPTAKPIAKPAENITPAKATNSIANTGKNDPRNGKVIDKNTVFRADIAATTGVGADVKDATSTPKVDKPGFTTNVNASDLTKQISWLDLGDKDHWIGATFTSSGNLVLNKGAIYRKEIMPGYVVEITVKSLKPFHATELYKKRLEERGATEEEKATYDPNAKNGYIGTNSDYNTERAFNNGEEAKVIAEAQNEWTEIRKEGIDTRTKKTTITSEFTGNVFSTVSPNMKVKHLLSRIVVI